MRKDLKFIWKGMTDSPIEKQVAANVRGKMIYLNQLSLGNSASAGEYEPRMYMTRILRFAELLSCSPCSFEA